MTSTAGSVNWLECGDPVHEIHKLGHTPSVFSFGAQGRLSRYPSFPRYPNSNQSFNFSPLGTFKNQINSIQFTDILRQIYGVLFGSDLCFNFWNEAIESFLMERLSYACVYWRPCRLIATYLHASPSNRCCFHTQDWFCFFRTIPILLAQHGHCLRRAPAR